MWLHESVGQTAGGSGFDVFFNVSPVARIIIFPFVILMVGSGIWNFRQRAAEGLWKKGQAFADDEEEDPDKLLWTIT